MKTGLRLGSIAGLTMLSGMAHGATATSTFQVQLDIQAECLIESTATLNFGTSGVITANIDQTTTVDVRCTNTTPYDIGLDAGTGGGDTTTRLMAGGSSESIQYRLFQDSGRTTNWGNAVSTDTKGATGNGTTQTHTIYGRVPVQTTPSPSNYSDTVTVTVTY